jgi:predicted HAD superfamily phosphohydrolase
MIYRDADIRHTIRTLGNLATCSSFNHFTIQTAKVAITSSIEYTQNTVIMSALGENSRVTEKGPDVAK